MKLLRNDIYENLRMALSTLLANKLRSFLTVFGVVIGIITVMLIASIISGIDVSVKKEVESFGTRSIYISKFNPAFTSDGYRAKSACAKSSPTTTRSRCRACRQSNCQFPSWISPTISLVRNDLGQSPACLRAQIPGGALQGNPARSLATTGDKQFLTKEIVGDIQEGN